MHSPPGAALFMGHYNACWLGGCRRHLSAPSGKIMSVRMVPGSVYVEICACVRTRADRSLRALGSHIFMATFDK